MATPWRSEEERQEYLEKQKEQTRSCKDCIHDEVCDWWAVDTGIPFVNPNTCDHYKNKADFVERKHNHD